MVKFLENVFPMHCDYVDPTPSSGGTFIWEDIDHGEDDDPPPAAPEVMEASDSDDDDESPGPDDPPSDDDDDDDDLPPLVPPDPRPRTRGNTDLGDWRAIYRGLDQAIAQGTAVLTTQSKSAPKRFKDIGKIEDPLERDKWYTAHYKENDTLLEKPPEDPVLTVIELPDGVSEADLHYLNTIYDKKNDGRYKARTVLSSGKKKLDGLDIGYERTFSPTADDFLRTRGKMTKSEWDPCFYYREVDGKKFWVLIYVDDLLMFETKGSGLYDEFAAEFEKVFEWTPFGTDLHDFLSIRIQQTPGKVTLDMEDYITRCAEEAFPGGIHHEYTVPADTDLPQVVEKALRQKDTSYAGTDIGKRFRRIVAQILYAAIQCRPDCLAFVNYLARVQAYASPDFLKRAERGLIYMHGTKHLKLTYSTTEDASIKFVWAPRVVTTGFADASFALARSTSGYVFLRLGGAVSWGTKKQESIALYTQHAEIMAGSLAACESIFLDGISKEAGVVRTSPMTLYMDSTSAIDLAYDPVLHAKTKHIDRRDLFIRELITRGTIVAKYISTDKNVADVLTKPLPRQPFMTHRATLGLLP